MLLFSMFQGGTLLLALLQNSSVEIAFKNTCWAQWLTLVILEIWEANMGKLLQARNLRAVWAT